MTSSRWLRSLFVASFLAATPMLAGCIAEQGTTGDEQDVTASAGTFQTFKGADGQYYFHLLANNHEKVLHSEGYTTLAKAKKGIESVKTNGVNIKSYKVLPAGNGEFYFNLVATNGQIIGTSETYSTKSNATKGANTVKSIVAQNLHTEAAKKGAKFEMVDGLDGDLYFHLRAANGEIVLASEGYESKAGALNGVASVRENGRDEDAYEIFETANGQAFFHLEATANGEIIARSEIYSSRSNAERAVEDIAALIASEKVADPK